MINNFQKLLILINHCENQIDNIRYQIKCAAWQSDFDKVAQLEVKELLLQIRIKEYIKAYKTKIENKHLENRIFGSKLAVLESHYQISK